MQTAPANSTISSPHPTALNVRKRGRGKAVQHLKAKSYVRLQKTIAIALSLLQHRGQVTHSRLETLAGTKCTMTIVEVLQSLGVVTQQQKVKDKETKQGEESDGAAKEDDGVVYVLGKEAPQKHEVLCEASRLRAQLTETVQDVTKLSETLLFRSDPPSITESCS